MSVWHPKEPPKSQSLIFCIMIKGIKCGTEARDRNNASEGFSTSGCCKPPTFCGFTYVNATFWTPPKNTVSFDSDCQTWSNNQESLCYDCKSCKAGVLAILKNDWRKLALINFCVLIVLNIIYSIGCCAFNNARRDSRYHRYRPYYY
ncbi:tetraspanin-7-like protein [Cinnamomum micranthum f. kanehirae]|uniref:Tetraspanin-7-like protein n=1 Tax=Cinnamomum micranthum f. kanehirae TaxID=337451 RepID=A0A3S3NNJ0_9MAGN|nr:tetraspanin-7-like protein [Cinnamomum micranthum f. kanehirae]